MSTYEYTDSIGDKLRISSNGYGGATLVAEGKSSLRRKTILIKHEDAPTVAAELLKAAGQESVIVAKSAAGVRGLSHGELECGGVITNADSEPEDLRATAAECVQLAASWIALAEYIEGKASREAEAEKKLQERRDALTAAYGWSYWEVLSPPSQKFIDDYLELEDKLAAK